MKTKTATITIKLTRDLEYDIVRMRFEVRATRVACTFQNDQAAIKRISELTSEVLDELKEGTPNG